MVDMLLMTIIWPALTGGLVMLIGLAGQAALVRIQSRRSHMPVEWQAAPWPTMCAGALGITLAFVISFRYTEGQWPIPPHTSWQWVFLMVIAAGLIGAANALTPVRALSMTSRLAVVGIALAIVAAILLRPLPPADHYAADWPAWIWKLGFGVIVLVLWLGMETVARREHSTWVLLSMIAALTAASIIIIEARFAKPSQLAGAIAATCGIALAISIALAFVKRQFPAHCGMTAPLAMILPAVLIFGWFYNAAAVPTASFILAGTAPLALLIAALPPLRTWTGRHGWRGWMMRIILIAILPAAAVILTMMREAPPELPTYEW
jgi:hypothetical protein